MEESHPLGRKEAHGGMRNVDGAPDETPPPDAHLRRPLKRPWSKGRRGVDAGEELGQVLLPQPCNDALYVLGARTRGAEGFHFWQETFEELVEGSKR